ncbi:unnamed protein product [Plutella xylostella]|uniref:(diamondback moth) hypothetical protein n=1 Tax=Plutella xylostella TaxID=51655 RepID=A0A8S4EC27_PLUXY|nr:unnamed protein product [Plutella xylostella]
MENVELMDHPPYSHDLSPNDYFTFPRIKDMLRGQRFSGPEEAVEAYKSAVLTIRLVVIDSIAFPFKEGVSARERSGLLFRQMAELQRCAVERQIAVVLTNEMSTRLGLSGGSIVGALGDAWSHRGTVRLLLSSTGRGRAAVLVKSNVAGAGVASFQRSIVGSMGDAWAHRGNVRLLLSSTGRGRAAVLVKSNVAGAGVASFQRPVVGSMGDAWAHRGTVRLLLSSTERGRAAVLVKSNVAGAGVASFQITKEGIRDVE